ncbi:hypothetical protein EON63_19410 [archaeon]|nr:MAG: hypothetical protein EON63_19410 [archaeon]
MANMVGVFSHVSSFTQPTGQWDVSRVRPCEAC